MCPPLDSTKAITHLSPRPSANATVPRCIPSDPIAQGAYHLARNALPPSILNHSIRVFLSAEWLAQREKSPWATSDRVPLLAVACLLHDIGCASQFEGTERFEVEGADVAANHLGHHDIAPEDVHEVWQAIALHTSPGIAERISPCARLVRQAVLLDFGSQLDQEQLAFRHSIEDEFPRLEIEKVLGDVVVEQALRHPSKAPPASWPGVLLRAKKENPGWTGVNKAF